jgi:hypothetical protein
MKINFKGTIMRTQCLKILGFLSDKQRKYSENGDRSQPQT